MPAFKEVGTVLEGYVKYRERNLAQSNHPEFLAHNDEIGNLGRGMLQMTVSVRGGTDRRRAVRDCGRHRGNQHGRAGHSGSKRSRGFNRRRQRGAGGSDEGERPEHRRSNRRPGGPERSKASRV